jgi:hypothetical protein
MLQVKEYNGYFQNGRFISADKVTPPDNVAVVVKVTGQVIPFKSADEKVLDIIKQKNIPHKAVEVNDEGHIIVDKDKDPELYDWAVNG